MTGYQDAVSAHYGASDLSRRIVDALRAAGKGPETLTREDLTSFDEFHTGGRESTRALARRAGLAAGMVVLDVGSGVGGPARTLAAEFGVHVVGLDLTEEFCRAAEMLTMMVRLGDRVTFRHGDALAMPFDDHAFDVVWSQNTLMNIEDKARLFAEVHRVLRPGGVFALETVMAGSGDELHFPTFWAASPALNFLVTPDEARAMLRVAGFAVEAWDDVTDEAVARARVRRDRPVAATLGRGVIVTDDVDRKIENSWRNSVEHRIAHVRAVMRSEERR